MIPQAVLLAVELERPIVPKIRMQMRASDQVGRCFGNLFAMWKSSPGFISAEFRETVLLQQLPNENQNRKLRIRKPTRIRIGDI
jgi:hypothetical protein